VNEDFSPRLPWKRSSKCADSACLEVARFKGEILVRNSQRPAELVRFTVAEWTAFTAGVKIGDFD
jgi:uncharacterized protein DUF397